MSAPQTLTEAASEIPRLLHSLDGSASKATLRRASELLVEQRHTTRETPRPTAVAVLDDLLDGGVQPGSLVEVVGRASCGRFAVVLSSLAAATDTGEAAALVDLGHHLDPQVATAVGVDLRRVLWLRPRRLDDALAAAEALVQAGFPLVVLDLGLPPVRGRVGTAAWLRLARSAVLHRASVLVTSPYRVSGCAANVVIVADRGRGFWSGAAGISRVLTGLSSRFDVAKRRGRRTGGDTVARFTVVESIPGVAVALGKTTLPTASKETRHA